MKHKVQIHFSEMLFAIQSMRGLEAHGEITHSFRFGTEKFMNPQDIRIEEPVTFVIFGATGDLTRRKLMPALYVLFKEGALTNDFSIVGFARRDYDDAGFRKLMSDSLHEHSRAEIDEPSIQEFCSHVRYYRGDLSDASAYAGLYAQFEQNVLPANRIFYLSITPELIDSTVGNLKHAGLITAPHSKHWTRVIVEKPFGNDAPSARLLNHRLLESLTESQIYRIDHYLGKETVQNILSFRFANTIFEPVFNRTYVDHIQIT
ncbi:MAG: hypothetical protein FJ220_07085, partial [Kiritimatiellaceae bacterium]|nr:hypothetical protein [Kiritimatiellaceae bacterium]